MAEFQKAHSLTQDAEGGWANNPKDSGGETYRGIARNHHPEWEGWKLVDTAKKVVGTNPPRLNASLVKVPGLGRMVDQFYQNEFWDAIRGDDIPDQRLANYAFDFAVNSHPTTAIRYLQGALNAHRHPNRFPPLVRDGVIGAKTLSAITAVGDDVGKVAETYWQARRGFLKSLAASNSDKAAFLMGWMRRLDALKERSERTA